VNREEHEGWLTKLLIVLLGAQLLGFLRSRPEFMQVEDMPAEPVTATLTAIATSAVWATWTETTSMPPAPSLWTRVAAWAKENTGHLIKGVEDITRSQVAMYVQSYVTEGWTLAQLTEAIGTVFGPERAQRIAVTEVTRAYAAAKYQVAEEMDALGLPQRIVWESEKDGLVCDICEDRDGHAEGEVYTDADGNDTTWTRYGAWGLEPPAHPNCRCGIMTEVA